MPERILKISEKEFNRAVAAAVKKALRGDPSRIGGAGVGKEAREKAGDSDFKFTRFLNALATKNHDLAPDEMEIVRRAMASGSGEAGGFLVPEEQAMDIIDLLRPMSVIRNTAARTLPMSTETMSIPRHKGGARAYWIGENTKIPTSQPAFGQINLRARMLVGLVQMPNNLLDDSSPSVEAFVRSDLAEVLALASDLAMIQGSGTGNEPRGIINYPDVNSITLGTGNGGKPGFDDLFDAMYEIEAVNGDMSDWIVHPRTRNTLRKIKNADNEYIFNRGGGPANATMEEREPDTLLEMPLRATTQIPIDLTQGTATNASYIVLGDFSEAIIAERKSLEFAVSTEAGDAFETVQTWIRVIMRMDFALRHPESFNVIRGVLP